MMIGDGAERGGSEEASTAFEDAWGLCGGLEERDAEEAANESVRAV